MAVGKIAWNPARGEARFAMLSGVEIVLAVEMQRLSALQVMADCDDFGLLYMRLTGFHLPTVAAALRTLVVRGDAEAALASLSVADMPAWREAMASAFAAHLKAAAPADEQEARDDANPPNGQV